MSFSIYEGGKKTGSFNLTVGKSVAEQTKLGFLNSIFPLIDDGDGVLSNFEISLLEELVDIAGGSDKRIAYSQKSCYEATKFENKLKNGQFNLNEFKNEIIQTSYHKDLSLSNLKKRFPEDRFDIIKNETNGYIEVSITNKKTSKLELLVQTDKNGVLQYVEDNSGIMHISNTYRNGYLDTYYDTEGDVILIGSKRTAQGLFNQLNKKESVGFTEGKNLDSLIHEIYYGNVTDIMNFYKEVSDGRDLIGDILSSEIEEELRFMYVNHIKEAVLGYYKEQGVNVKDVSHQLNDEIETQINNEKPDSTYIITAFDTLERRSMAPPPENQDNIAPNGKIDESFKQQSTGDCWLLAAIMAINDIPKGKAILEKNLTVNSDGSVTVYLTGAEKEYTITPEELEDNSQLATGDMDVRAIEIAVNKYFKEQGGIEGHPDINGNYGDTALEILLGEKIYSGLLNRGSDLDELIYPNRNARWKISDEDINNFNKQNTIHLVDGNKGDYTCSNGIKLLEHHQYQVKGSDENFIYVSESHHPDIVKPIPIEDFKNFFNSYHLLEL